MAAPNNEPSPLLRLTFLSVVVIAMFLALLARLWFLQVLAGDRYVELADSTSLRQVVTEAPRGSILAADGSELVRNRQALTVSVDRQVLLDLDGEPANDESEQVIARLAHLLELDTDEVMGRLASRRFSALRPVPVAVDVAPEIVFSLRENQELFPGVLTESLPVREYPHGTLASHLVGYLGEISDEELASERFSGYFRGDLVGRAGIEQSFESDLRGTPGNRVLLVNAQGRVLDVQSEREALPGNDLRTTIDLELQDAVEQLLSSGIEASREIQRDDGRFLPSVAGSAIVLDARTGGVLAMASYPDFDPRAFVGGVSQDYWAFVNDRENFQPLLNRAVAGTYPPGSVFKTASGAAMVEAGLVGPRSRVPCPPAFEVGGNTFNNWNRGVDEGAMDLAVALQRSCDTYFYDLAYRQWDRERSQGDDVDEVLPRVAERFGFGRRLGIDLPGESVGRVPGRQWREEFWLATRDTYCAQADAAEPGSFERELLTDLCQFGGVWRGGDAINSSIGQGDVLATPLQVAASYQAIANDGVLLRPHVGAQVLGPDGTVVREIEPEVVDELGLDDATLAVIREGLEDTVMDPRGTGNSAFTGFPFDEVTVAGKTGTAEVRPRVPFAWFAAYAPADEPEIVVAVNVEEGGGGSQTAAPIVRNILEFYFGVTSVEDAEFEAGDEILD
jgi:penicillin-binding protein 2